ncbi:MAG TPA: prolipoprotein diacylglyceryl transferase [bacterium]|nr:prolipoprotein diacylglyceryl transferase [bacterium]
MNPDIFKPVYDFLGLSYPGSYITILFFSFFMAFPIVYITAKRLGLTPWKQMLLPLTIVPTALVFSRIFHILFEGMFMYYIDGLKQNGISYLFTVMLNPFVSGHVFYGGLLGGFLAGALTTMANYPKDWKKFLLTADAAAIVVANGLWLTRIGCFFEGCCFGIPSKLFGISFPQGSRTMFLLYKIDPDHTSLFTETQPIIPTQLIHSTSNLIILAILIKLMFTGKPRNPGNIAAIFLILYSITRFLIEFLRFDIRGSFLFFSTSQWISLIILYGGYELYKYTTGRKTA